jgi:signal transduction histidine kinase
MAEQPYAAAHKRPRRRLFTKYALLFIGLIGGALLINSGLDFWFSYQENKAALVRVQQEKAASAAQRIGEFVEEIKSQIGWTTHAQWAAGPLDQRRLDYERLLRQVPAITELSQLSGQGKEQLKVSRLSMNANDSQADFSQSPAFTEATARRVWFSPVYFRKESEPYMTLAMARDGKNAGVTVAEINLKLIWDVITALKIGQGGYAYVVDGRGRLIAHPDISLVLRDTDLSKLPQVATALDPQHGQVPVNTADNVAGHAVLTAHAMIPQLGWRVFVEMPRSEAFAPLYGAALRTVALLALGLIAATLLALFIARRMTGPIRAIAEGAERLGAGDLSRRIDVQTGDELEALADQFNRMATDLQKSYAELEQRVADRTAELSEALEQQTATAEVLGVINSSPDDLAPVFATILEKAHNLCGADFGGLLIFDGELLHPVAQHNMPPRFTELIASGFRPGHNFSKLLCGASFAHIDDMKELLGQAPADSITHAAVEVAGIRTQLMVPLRKDDKLLGVITANRGIVRPFTDKEIALLQNFAAQAVIAMENARLLNALRERTDELAHSVEELKVLAEVGQAVSSTLDLGAVLSTILHRSVDLTPSDAGVIFRYSQNRRVFRLFEAVGWDTTLTDKVRDMRIEENATAMGDVIRSRAPVHIPDLHERPSNLLRDVTLAAGFHSVLIIPLVGADQIFGVLQLQRRAPGAFPEQAVRLLQTLASQSVLAIQNARLFREIAEKSEQLALASQHKSQFLANMSHELRTPLNAILGYTELLVDRIYGDLPAKAADVLERVQNNGKHLLALINDVLDLSKIEAGQLVFTFEDYALPDIVHTVVTATEPLASTKGLKLTATIQPGMPTGHGDARRLSQVLLNLVGNAIKFTDEGEVAIGANVENASFVLTVRDTGPGIAPADQDKIFEEFQQVDSSNNRKKGGTGLGLAISKRMVEMQGGSISVQSKVGQGATFRVTLPIQVEHLPEELMGAA